MRKMGFLGGVIRSPRDPPMLQGRNRGHPTQIPPLSPPPPKKETPLFPLDAFIMALPLLLGKAIKLLFILYILFLFVGFFSFFFGGGVSFTFYFVLVASFPALFNICLRIYLFLCLFSTYRLHFFACTLISPRYVHVCL